MRSKIAICQEWFWSKKEEKQEEPEKTKSNKIVHELNFVLDGGNGYNCSYIGDLTDNLYKEDKNDSVANVFWTYKDEVYDYLYYANLSDSYSADECENLLYNFDYFFKEGEAKAIKNFKKNISQKSLPYKFGLPEGMTKNEFRAELTHNLRAILNEIDIVTDTVLKDLKEENESTSHVSSRKSALTGKFNKYVTQINSLADLLWDKISKSPKADIAQEGLFDMFKKKEEDKPVSRWNFYTLFIYVKFYNKNFISLYKKAGKEYADIVKKMVAKYYKYKDWKMPGYDKARAEFEKEVKGLCEKLLVSNKPLFDKTRNILKGVCNGIDGVKYPLAASAWVNDGSYNPEYKGDVHLSVYALSEIGTDSDIYTVWGEEFKSNIKFKTIPATTQKVILNQLLKEVKDVVEPETDIFVPTGNYVEAYDSGKYGDYETGIPNDIVPSMLYGIDDQGEYLPAPDVDKNELEAAIQQCLDGLNVSQEEYSVAAEMTFGENLKSTFNLSGDRGIVNVVCEGKNASGVIRTIRDEIMPGLFGAYNEVREQIADKFYGRLPNDAYTYIKEMEKRQLKLKELTSKVTGEMSDKDLEKAKKGLASLKRVKYDEIPNNASEWTGNIHLMAKYEYEIGSRCEIIDIMLIVKFLRDHTKSYIKNHSGATYYKILKDLKDWMTKNVTITYEQDGNIIKTVKI